jgi:hypothetical protein
MQAVQIRHLRDLASIAALPQRGWLHARMLTTAQAAQRDGPVNGLGTLSCAIALQPLPESPPSAWAPRDDLSCHRALASHSQLLNLASPIG